ncbi:MAG: hypothetical protein KF745_12185 [Phycisphaeraceae bacterium]|nr:hypothetical protein [Phycisphaeraceae bacterium]
MRSSCASLSPVLARHGFPGRYVDVFTAARASVISPPQPRPSPATITRDQLIALGRAAASSPTGGYRFVPLAIRALAGHPDDVQVRLLLAAAYVRLGLRTPAGEQIAALPVVVQADPGVEALLRAARQMPDDLVRESALHATLDHNLRALRARGISVDVDPPGEPDPSQVGLEEVFRASDGNVLRRRDGQWLRFEDDLGTARAFQFPALDAGGVQGPVTLDGIGSLWLLLRLSELTPARSDGYQPRINIVQADEAEFLDVLSVCDLSGVLSQERVRLFVGPDAGARFAADLTGRLHLMIAGPVVSGGTQRTPVDPPVGETIDEALRRQARLLDQLTGRVRSHYAGLDRNSWTVRFRGGSHAAGSDRPLRVLLPTTLHSTFVRHSAADLAEALRSRGCEVEVLIEPDSASLLSTVAYLEAFDRFRPDLVVLMNYTRANLAGAIPDGVPCVCWIQDAMPHLYDAATGRAQGPLDFIAGHAPAVLSREFGYPSERMIPTPVVASGTKFHAGPVEPMLRKRLECEVAYASHHSETPDRLHRRLVAEAGHPGVARALEDLYPQIAGIVARSGWHLLQPEIRGAVEGAVTRLSGPAPDPRLRARLINNYAMPLADRLLRHQTLAWTASIARRRGWRFMIHGRGWDDPEADAALAEFAAGELPHDDALRASYQCAAAHLHVSVHWMYHQRVMECALAGGLPLCRRKGDDLALLEAHVVNHVTREASPVATMLTPDRPLVYDVISHPESARLAALLQRLEHPRANRSRMYIPGSWARECLEAWHGGPAPSDAAWLLGDWAQTTYADEAGLERVLIQAVESPRWRADAAAGIRARVERQYTYERAAARLLEGVVWGLATEGVARNR